MTGGSGTGGAAARLMVLMRRGGLIFVRDGEWFFAPSAEEQIEAFLASFLPVDELVFCRTREKMKSDEV